MASLLGWWRAVLRLFEWRSASANHRWVEPGNEITRAILAGTVPQLPALPPSEAAISRVAAEASFGVRFEVPLLSDEGTGPRSAESAGPAADPMPAGRPAADDAAPASPDDQPARRRRGRHAA